MTMRKLSNVSSIYGAPMGRTETTYHADQHDPHKFSIQLIRLDNGGYDSGGAYWGIGQQLYWAYADNMPNRVEMFFRSPDRDTAKAYLRDKYPNAKFYR